MYQRASPLYSHKGSGRAVPDPYGSRKGTCCGGCGISDTMLAGMMQTGCLQNESMGFERCYQFESIPAGVSQNLPALGRDHGPLQTKAESVIVGYYTSAIRCFRQLGQPQPEARDAMTATHSFPQTEHFQYAFLPLPMDTSVGLSVFFA